MLQCTTPSANAHIHAHTRARAHARTPVTKRMHVARCVHCSRATFPCTTRSQRHKLLGVRSGQQKTGCSACHTVVRVSVLTCCCCPLIVSSPPPPTTDVCRWAAFPSPLSHSLQQLVALFSRVALHSSCCGGWTRVTSKQSENARATAAVIPRMLCTKGTNCAVLYSMSSWNAERACLGGVSHL